MTDGLNFQQSVDFQTAHAYTCKLVAPGAPKSIALIFPAMGKVDDYMSALWHPEFMLPDSRQGNFHMTLWVKAQTEVQLYFIRGSHTRVYISFFGNVQLRSMHVPVLVIHVNDKLLSTPRLLWSFKEDSWACGYNLVRQSTVILFHVCTKTLIAFLASMACAVHRMHSQKIQPPFVALHALSPELMLNKQVQGLQKRIRRRSMKKVALPADHAAGNLNVGCISLSGLCIFAFLAIPFPLLFLF